MRMKCTIVNDDGSTSTEYVELGTEVEEMLERARAGWRRLAKEGTPYWCTHEGRDVLHPAAYWQDDSPSEPIHKKHGVRCRVCGGYIQEG